MGKTQKERAADKKKAKSEMTVKMQELFRQIWDEREDEGGYCYCFETGKALHGSKYRSNTCCYDHVLEKSKYPEYALVKENIVILDPDVHTKKTGDIEKTPKIKEYREYLLSLHQQNKL